MFDELEFIHTESKVVVFAPTELVKVYPLELLTAIPVEPDDPEFIVAWNVRLVPGPSPVETLELYKRNM
jgi:hypothetical protein